MLTFIFKLVISLVTIGLATYKVPVRLALKISQQRSARLNKSNVESHSTLECKNQYIPRSLSKYQTHSKTSQPEGDQTQPHNETKFHRKIQQFRVRALHSPGHELSSTLSQGHETTVINV